MSKGVKVCATYSVVTPMFLSGADQSKPELRVSSIRGAMRFWWRALAWNRCKGNLEKIRDEESLLFGSTLTGQGMLMRLLNPKDLRSFLEKHNDDTNTYWNERKDDGLKYISYGLNENCRRGAFVSVKDGRSDDVHFEIECRLKSSIVKDENFDRVEMLKSALIALGTFGGLGAKSRKGFGSLNIESISHGEKNSHPKIEKDVKKRVGELLSKSSCEVVPPYSAFSNGRIGECPCQVVDLGIGAAASADAINEVGSKLKDFLYKKKVQPKKHKAIFGLPRVGVSDKRRAAPVQYHVYESEGRFRVLATVFPAAWLDPRDRGGESAAWNILQDFIKTFEGGEVLYSAPEASHDE